MMNENAGFNIRRPANGYGKYALTVVLLATIGFIQGYNRAMADNGGPVLHLRVFNYNQEIPEDIVSARSAAFVLVENENTNRTAWKDLSTEVHKMMVRTGTDVIGYYNIYDVFAGPETQRYFAEDLLKREVKNILIIENQQGSIRLTVTKFNEQGTFMDHGQNAWKSENRDLQKVLGDYRRAIGNSGQRRTNFLMADFPEFFEDTRLIKKQRFEIFNQDLKLDKLAVPVFPGLKLPPGSETENTANPVREKILSYQQRWKVDSLELAGIMKSYPFAYGFVGEDIDEKKLRDQGYQFILYYLHTSGKVIHKLLNYKSDKNVTDNSTMKSSGGKPELVTLRAHRPVYKYYIKHIFSGEVYLGDTWDAAENWQKALLNHINGIKSKIKQ